MVVERAVVGEQPARQRLALHLGRTRDDENGHVVGNQFVGEFDDESVVADESNSGGFGLRNPCARATRVAVRP